MGARCAGCCAESSWKYQFEPMTPSERELVINALLTYERETMALTRQPD
jgi:hypothetical protein